MPKPVYNGAVGKADFGDIGGGAKPRVRVAAKVSTRQNGNAIQQVNQNLGKNPNHAPRRAGQGNNNQPLANNANQNNTAQNQTSVTRTGTPGTARASQQGVLNGQGHQKTTQPNQNQNQTNLPNNAPQNTNGNVNTQQAGQTAQTNTPFHQRHHNPVPLDYDPNQVNNPEGNERTLRLPPIANTVRQIVGLVLRQNDVFINPAGINKYFNPNYQPDNRAHVRVPDPLHNLILNISSQALALLDNSRQTNGRIIRQIAAEVSQRFQQQIETARTSMLHNADLGAKTFRQLNVNERMMLAVESLTLHLPPSDTAESLRAFQPKEILSGLFLARGLIAAQENRADIRNLVAFQSSVLPDEISLTALRDVGQLVKILISDTIGAKSAANLDQAVQKFIRLLLANNELGVLLASVSLATQTHYSSGLVSRSLALAQIYDLISRLIIAGEKALKDAASGNRTVNNPAPTGKTDGLAFGVSKSSENDEPVLPGTKLQGAESALRQFLEFNPAFVFDNSASAFNNSEDARDAQKNFVSIYQNDIDNWLKSGNHRFVKDFELEKPVGVVIERSGDGIFTSNTVRIVLVRDGSIEGWHFLKSFLIK